MTGIIENILDDKMYGGFLVSHDSRQH